ncbi:MAG TPA: methyltransferase domain-containing protein [Ilumatobacteraceae bacterium]|nr:methyltransferase domain-containing protein [Ilumatobacteraceae bacterium]
MGFYNTRIVPRIINCGCGTPAFGETRTRVLGGLTGEVLEIGFGTGHNLAHYPPSVSRIHAVEPSARSIELAAERIAASSAEVVVSGDDAQQLALADESFATVVSTWSLCTIPDPDAAMAEIVRVLKPGGRFHFVEHGKSPDAKVARRQRRFEPMWRRMSGNCHITRNIDDIVRSSGLEMVSLNTFAHPKDFKVMNWTFEGVAVRR